MSDELMLKGETQMDAESLGLKNIDEREYAKPEIDFKSLLRKKRFSLIIIRCFDIFASFFGIMTLLIPFIIIFMIIKITSKGPVFFRQTRIGKGGKEFRIIKFRTMVTESEKSGMQITVGNDSRITKIGNILRKTKVDELPQLFNVFLGQMSLVGYRPEVPKYVAMYNDYQKNILAIRPGITDLASIEFKDENKILEQCDNPEEKYIKEIMPQKIKYNIEYMQKMSLFFNLKIIFKTFFAILK